MKNYLMSIGLEVWTLVEKGYDVPKANPIEAEDNKLFWEYAKALNTLQDGPSKKILAKVLKNEKPSRCSRKQKIRSKNLNPSI
jgi:hypothetical protein